MREHRTNTNQSLLCTHSDPDLGKYKRTTSWWLSRKRPSVNTRDEYPSVLNGATEHKGYDTLGKPGSAHEATEQSRWMLRDVTLRRSCRSEGTSL